MSIYNVDYNVFIIENLPPDKRKVKTIAWLNALFTTVKENHNDIFNVFRPDIILRAKQNGQKIVMEDILNTTFNVVGPPFIFIDNTGDDVKADVFFNESEGLPASFLYNESEAQPAFIFNNESELSENNKFIVFVPNAVLTAVTAEVIAIEVDRLRPYSTQYDIVGY